MGTKRSVGQALQFKVGLSEIEPEIWRRIQVPRRYTFWDLHVAIQDAFGWWDYHLHLFRVRDPESDEVHDIGIPDDEPMVGEVPCLPGWEIPIAYYFRAPGTTAEYLYDFGDDWQHSVVFEDAVPRVKGQKYPVCLDGARARPPEDCGGVPGYEELLQIVRDPTHEEYSSTMTWLGGHYDPDGFDVTRVRFDNPKKRWRTAFQDEPG